VDFFFGEVGILNPEANPLLPITDADMLSRGDIAFVVFRGDNGLDFFMTEFEPLRGDIGVEQVLEDLEEGVVLRGDIGVEPDLEGIPRGDKGLVEEEEEEEKVPRGDMGLELLAVL